MDGRAEPQRFATLDGLRGIAAVMVMFYHAAPNAPLAAPAGYLAVDMFFALSGLVLAQAYEQRLRAGLTPREFAWLRLARIYPMYLVGTVVGAILVGFRPASVLLIPDFSGHWLYPSNTPMWSLLFELIVNIAFGFVALKTGWRGIAAILAASGGWLAWSALGPCGSLAGCGMRDWIWLGLPRTVFSFTLGVALFRLRAQLAIPRRTSWLGWLLLPALAGVLIFQPFAAVWWELACVFAIFPALLWCGARWELPRPGPALALGNLSYPLYCIHAPLLWAAGKAGLAAAPVCAALIAAAWALDRWVDRPARTALAGLVRRSIAAPRAQTRIGIST
jgi:peptidoglycan/LPS O-acetylase OafA/YrhL